MDVGEAFSRDGCVDGCVVGAEDGQQKIRLQLKTGVTPPVAENSK